MLSFDSLLGSSGAVGIQPVLGKAADVWGYPISYACAAAIQGLSLPFVWLARREQSESDAIPRRAAEGREDRAVSREEAP